MERLAFIGNLGGDPEMRFTVSGQAVTNFSVAVNRKWKNQDGSPGEETKWFRVAVWGNQAASCNEYLKKGRQVYVEGRVSASAWSDKATGEPRAGLEVTASSVQFLGGGQTNGSADSPFAEDESAPF